MTGSSSYEQHRSDARARLAASGLNRPGPGSVSWQINAEIVVVAGWGRAILLQLAHPLVSAGVDDHSSFRTGALTRLARLRSTISAMLSLTFGDDDEALAAAATINAIHDRVFGHLRHSAGPFPPGTAYSAHDAELLRWVHATLLDSIPRIYQRLVGPLTPAERDRYCVEAAVMEPLLGMPAGSVPRDATRLDLDLRAAFAGGRLTVTDRSRRLARAVLFPRGWRLLWPVFRPVQLLTIGLLPDEVRQAYGFTWTPREAAALGRWTRALRWLVARTPPVVRQWPIARRRRPRHAAAPTGPSRDDSLADRGSDARAVR